MAKLTTDLAGVRLDYWVVDRYHKRGLWLCRCDCGTERLISTTTLVRRLSKSCGCQRANLVRSAKLRHGGCETPEYRTWAAMKARCLNPQDARYHRYGGRGIKVCDAWINDFAQFFADMGSKPSKKHSIERINNDGDYCPSNCRWATPREQGRNTSRNRRIAALGSVATLGEWSAKTSVKRETIARRLNAGWKPDEAVALTERRFNDNQARARKITALGQSKTLSGWASHSGIRMHTIKRRLQLGWTPEEAVTLPTRRLLKRTTEART